MEEIIYHYTTLEAFKNIIETKKFWATNMFYTKDYAEIVHGQYLHNLLISNSNKPKIQDDQYIEFENLIKSISLPSSEIYFLSFSKRKNDLSQWRAYASNGICLALDPALFSDSRPSHCIYEEDEKRETLMAIIELYSDFIKEPNKFDFDYLHNISENYSKEKIINLVENYFLEKVEKEFPLHCRNYGVYPTANMFFLLQSLLLGFFLVAKEGYYKVEDEVRYLYVPQSEESKKIRIARNLLTPYFEVDFSLKSIKEIWINSRIENFQLMKYSIEKLWISNTEDNLLIPYIIPANLSIR